MLRVDTLSIVAEVHHQHALRYFVDKMLVARAVRGFLSLVARTNIAVPAFAKAPDPFPASILWVYLDVVQDMALKTAEFRVEVRAFFHRVAADAPYSFAVASGFRFALSAMPRASPSGPA